jgi:hypothetical protein
MGEHQLHETRWNVEQSDDGRICISWFIKTSLNTLTFCVLAGCPENGTGPEVLLRAGAVLMLTGNPAIKQTGHMPVDQATIKLVDAAGNDDEAGRASDAS